MVASRVTHRLLFLPNAFLSLQTAFALTNNLALTPPMGWNDWNSYHCGISESAVTNTANIMATNGMKAAGYQFVNIDDGWAGSRDSNGVIQAYSMAGKFPHGIKWLADYVHSKGLKLGVYTDHGTNTCSHCISTTISPTGKQPGSYNYEYIDAFTYASWGVDYLKDDSCNLPSGDIPYDDYFRMADGLMKSGSDITFSLCPNRRHYEYWSPDVGNLWRTTGDIGSTFSSMNGKIDQNSRSAYLAGPGRWNDPDMLEVGNGEFASNLTAARSHFSMWCMMAAPLLAGNNLTTMSAATLAILTNSEAIAVDQDPAGEQGVRVGGTPGFGEVWSKPLGYDFTTRAVALFNRSATTAINITCTWTNLCLQPGPATVRDLWAHADLGTFTDSFTTNVPPEGLVLLKVAGMALPPPGLGTNYLSDQQPIYAYTGWGTQAKDKSIGGNPITLGGVTYSKGIGTHAIGGQEYDLGGVCSRFHAVVGVDDEVGNNVSVIFQVLADGRKIYDSGIMTGGMSPKTVNLDVTGVRRLTLGVTDTGNDASGNRNSYDHSDWADALVVVTNTAPQLPRAPTGLSAKAGSAITLTWNDTLAAIGYVVKRSSLSGGSYTPIATNGFVTTFTDKDVIVGTNYYYVVSAISSIGEGPDSSEIMGTPCMPPPVPTGITAIGTNSQITLNWIASAGATSYTISRFTRDTPPVIVKTGLTDTTFIDHGATGGIIYFYLVAANNDCGQSAYSDFVPAVTTPSAPTGLKATAGNEEVFLTWNAVAGATSYNAKRSTTSGSSYSTIASNLTSTSYADFSVTNGKTYYYVVLAVNASGEGTDSLEAFATPMAPLTAYWTNTVTAASQAWNLNANWTNTANYPNSVGELAVISANISAPQTINLNQTVMIGSLGLGDTDGSAAYTLAGGGGSLIFSDNGASVLTELATSAGDTITAPVISTTNLVVVNNAPYPLTLTGTLTSSGGTLTIGSGALQIGDGGTTGNLVAVNVEDNGALIFNRSDDTTMSGIISGSGTVTKTGAGTLTLSGANSFLGTVTISAGTLLVGNGSALGSTSSSAIITNGGTLDVNGNNLSGESIIASGSGVGGKGAIVSSGSQQTHALRNVALAGDTTLGGASQWNPSNNQNRWDIRAGSNSSTNGCTLSTGGHAYKLTKTGGNQISLVAVDVDPALGVVDIQQGLMGWETATSSMGNPASNFIVRAGATLSFYNANTAWNKHFILYGDGITATVTNWSGANVIIGSVQLNGSCVFAGGGTSLSLANTVSGSGSLIKNGGYTVNLAATGFYNGDTVVNAGTLALVGNGSIVGSPRILMAAGATLDVSLRSDGTLTVADNQTLSGNGTVNGNAVIGSGATLLPGGSIGTLTFNNNLTLSGGSRTVMEIDKSVSPSNDVLQVNGNLIYGGTLVITNIGTMAFAEGDHFKLFSAGGYSGAFTSIVPAIPGLNLAWDTNDLGGGIVRIVALPTESPKFIGITTNGNNFILSGKNGVPGWPYYVLASSNLTLPLKNWSIIATNTFNAGGQFNFTNPINFTLPQMFYLLQLP